MPQYENLGKRAKSRAKREEEKNNTKRRDDTYCGDPSSKKLVLFLMLGEQFRKQQEHREEIRVKAEEDIKKMSDSEFQRLLEMCGPDEKKVAMELRQK